MLKKTALCDKQEKDVDHKIQYCGNSSTNWKWIIKKHVPNGCDWHTGLQQGMYL